MIILPYCYSRTGFIAIISGNVSFIQFCAACVSVQYSIFAITNLQISMSPKIMQLIKRQNWFRPICEGGKVTVFLVNAVALVTQHADYLLRHTPFTVGTFSGDMNVDNWNHQMWREQINKYQVLVMTAQIMVNIVEAAFISKFAISGYLQLLITKS